MLLILKDNKARRKKAILIKRIAAAHGAIRVQLACGINKRIGLHLRYCNAQDPDRAVHIRSTQTAQREKGFSYQGKGHLLARILRKDTFCALCDKSRLQPLFHRSAHDRSGRCPYGIAGDAMLARDVARLGSSFRSNRSFRIGVFVPAPPFRARYFLDCKARDSQQITTPAFAEASHARRSGRGAHRVLQKASWNKGDAARIPLKLLRTKWGSAYLILTHSAKKPVRRSHCPHRKALLVSVSKDTVRPCHTPFPNDKGCVRLALACPDRNDRHFGAVRCVRLCKRVLREFGQEWARACSRFP